LSLCLCCVCVRVVGWVSHSFPQLSCFLLSFVACVFHTLCVSRLLIGAMYITTQYWNVYVKYVQVVCVRNCFRTQNNCPEL
jgi:hypothetical protein